MSFVNVTEPLAVAVAVGDCACNTESTHRPITAVPAVSTNREGKSVANLFRGVSLIVLPLVGPASRVEDAQQTAIRDT